MNSGASGQKAASLNPGKFNLVGEKHDESDKRRADEQAFVRSVSPDLAYWTEPEFGGDDRNLRGLHKAVLLK